MYAWSDDSALWQVRHGEDGSRTNSAMAYLCARLEGSDRPAANMTANWQSDDDEDSGHA